MIGQLVVDYDRVSLPGVGTFYVELMPASFTDKGFSMNPPYKTLSFNQVQTDDSLLVSLYAKSNQLDEEVARPYIVQFLQELKQVLIEKKTIILPGLGKLRATRENNFFFVSDEGLDIFPEGFALKPVSLKSLAGLEIEPINIQVPLPPTASDPAQPTIAETPAAEEIPVEEAPAAEETLPAAEEAPVEETPAAEVPAEEPQPTEEKLLSAEEPLPIEAPLTTEAPVETPVETSEPVAVQQEQPEAKPRKKFRWWVLLIVVLALAVIALASFLVLAQVAPDFIDSILYTPEELRIIYY